MTPQKSLATQIVELIHMDGLAVGAHLPAQMLADRLRVSRSPINEALQQLHEKGVLSRQRNRGYFVAQAVTARTDELAAELGLQEHDVLTDVYFRIADDLLRGELAAAVTETQMRARYQLTPAQLNAVLGRIANEGWAERRPGYGWEFSGMMRTPDALLQSYRLRLALEPAALLEPGYHLDPAILARCRQAELHLLAGGIETDTADQLHDRGVRFHESLVEASGNPFFIDTVRRVNRVRRLLSYRSMRDRKRYKQHCEQHLHILELLEQGRNADASQALREHLQSTLSNIGQITDILATEPTAPKRRRA
ncbi:GntR family transcriptional regulator [Bordetella genomosp. 4]|uniref:GntR family transcriptional regulator n=1 Tax=Bordetella genomosp. 4 TaxID=463044 RepID=A0A261V0U2_9BORD|nr:GntR family transcriptional regulator [Bordetella genomosp. 4]OZI41543.1 GntR family transcriptional regulator [Bordetella genomosp. 4]OZI67471.1 GntR family transcriptional regulator [Bordetella genomosp. 4]